MDYTGTVKKTTVSNHLENDKDGEIKDNSILTNIINVNGSEDFTLDNNIVTWYAKGKDIFYTGTTKKEQPLNIVTKYYLNGKVTKATNMIGKSGNVKIEISLLNNSLLRTNNTFTPYVVALGTMIDSDTNTDIEVTNGKVTDTGTRNVLLAISAQVFMNILILVNLKVLTKLPLHIIQQILK